MYVEASWPRTENDKAELQSEWLSTKDSRCHVSFFYHSYGESVGKLEVQVMGDRMHRFPVSVLDGNSTDTWIPASVDIGRVSKARVVFRGTVGSGYDGDIAIDDVAFHDCKLEYLCNLTMETSCETEPKCINRTNVCDFQPNCKDRTDEANCGTCDFERPGTCGWVSNHPAAFQKMPGAEDLYGPGYDHTLGTGDGHYMMAETTWYHDGDEHDSETISTPVFAKTGKRCRIRFSMLRILERMVP